MAAVIAAMAVSGCDMRAPRLGDLDLVARAGDHRLGIDRMAELLAASRTVPLERPVVERFVHRWVEYSLFAQRLAAGDSLTDSTWVVRAMWPDLERARVDAFHDQMVRRRVQLDSAAVDSAYHAGELRVLYHLLVPAPPGAPAPERERARSRAAAARRRLVAGESWERVYAAVSDAAAGGDGGRLGVVRRGELVAEVESVAFALAPGEVSAVTETGFGFHVFWRPGPDAARHELRVWMEADLVQRADSTYLADLSRRWALSVRPDAPSRAREAAEAPLAFLDSRETLGTYRGGKFTVGHFVQWLQVLPAHMQQQAVAADNRQMERFLLSLMRNHVLMKEAADRGAVVPEPDFAFARERYVKDVEAVRRRLGLDSVLAQVARPTLRRAAALEAVDSYFASMMESLQNLVIVPPFLANELRRAASWEVSAPGIDRAIQRALDARRAAAGGTDGS